MTEHVAADGLLVSIPVFLGSSFAMSFLVCLCLFWRDRQTLYRCAIASVAIAQFAAWWLPCVFFLAYAAKRSTVPWHEAVTGTMGLSLLLFPHMPIILLLIIVVAIRHFRGPDKSYKTEALVGLAVAVMGAAWTTFAAEALNVAY